MKKTRATKFFYHYNKPQSQRAGTPKLSFHYKGVCHIVDGVSISVPTKTEVRKTQPRIVVVGYAKIEDVDISDGVVVVNRPRSLKEQGLTVLTVNE